MFVKSKTYNTDHQKYVKFWYFTWLYDYTLYISVKTKILKILVIYSSC